MIVPRRPRGPFHQRFSIVIQIRWKFRSALIQVVVKWSLWNIAHGTTACCRAMYTIYSDISPYNGVTLKPIYIEIELRQKKTFVNGPRGYVNAIHPLEQYNLKKTSKWSLLLNFEQQYLLNNRRLWVQVLHRWDIACPPHILQLFFQNINPSVENEWRIDVLDI